MSNPESEETYTVIYGALKHPVRRKILRLLNVQHYSYTDLLNKLDLDTGHLNYHLENLGELVTKTGEGKYRLSEYGKAAVKLMAGVEENEPTPSEKAKNPFSKRKMMRLSQAIAVIALLAAAVFLMNLSVDSNYFSTVQQLQLDSRFLSLTLQEPL